MVVMEVSGNNDETELWWEIYNLVNRIPREDCLGDAPDASSITTELEKLISINYTKI